MLNRGRVDITTAGRVGHERLVARELRRQVGRNLYRHDLRSRWLQMFDPGIGAKIKSATLFAVIGCGRSRALRCDALAYQSQQPRVVTIGDDIDMLGEEPLELRGTGSCEDLERVDLVSKVGRFRGNSNSRADEIADQSRRASGDTALGFVKGGKTALAGDCRSVQVNEWRFDAHGQQSRASQDSSVAMVVVAGLVVAQHQCMPQVQ